MSGGAGGGGGGGGLSNLGIVLTTILLFTLLVLIAQLVYLLWHRGVFRRCSSGIGGINAGDGLRMYQSSRSPFSSKDFLYFFCIKPHRCVLSKSLSATVDNDDSSLNRQLEADVVEIDVFRMNGIAGVPGPPRFLFTIKEEEWEGWESQAEKQRCSSDRNSSKLSLKDCLKLTEETPVLDGGESTNTTTYSTPCASPAYFTPFSSPLNEIFSGAAKG